MTSTAVYVTADTDWDQYLDDEILIYTIYIGDDEGEPTTGKLYTSRTRNGAIDLGEKIARDRGLELVID